ncbi:hypothetical protein [Demequina litorisediminis]|uniref:hypothetical protein n=1 Tax=Demequina litorisediminis TaxID=1849022 RepID=UPI0024E18072|nr:hypothetical protein [Demequina litorisediminis]
MTSFRSRQWSFQNVFAAVTLGSSLVAVVVLFFIADAWGEAPWLAWPTLALLAATLVIPTSVEVGAHEVVVRLAGCTVRRIEPHRRALRAATHVPTPARLWRLGTAVGHEQPQRAGVHHHGVNGGGAESARCLGGVPRRRR